MIWVYCYYLTLTVFSWGFSGDQTTPRCKYKLINSWPVSQWKNECSSLFILYEARVKFPTMPLFCGWLDSANSFWVRVAENESISPQWHHTTCAHRGERPKSNHGQTMADRKHKLWYFKGLQFVSSEPWTDNGWVKICSVIEVIWWPCHQHFHQTSTYKTCVQGVMVWIVGYDRWQVAGGGRWEVVAGRTSDLNSYLSF